MVMNETIINLPVYRETRFRNPSPYERRIGFWVDRIGSEQQTEKSVSGLRILGQYAVVSVEAGAGELLTKTKGVHSVQTGDVLLLTPEEPAAYHPRNTWFTRWIVWNGPAARQQADAFGKDRQPVFRRTAEIAHMAFFELARLMELESKAAALERQAVVLNMLAALLRTEQTAGFTGNPGPDWEALIKHIRRHLDSRPAPDELAKMCSMSVSHFRRMFRRHTGRSPMEFLMAERISTAKALLSGGASIKQAAQETGFSDQFHFMRVFKKIAGQTAGRFIAATRSSGPSAGFKSASRSTCRPQTCAASEKRPTVP